MERSYTNKGNLNGKPRIPFEKLSADSIKFVTLVCKLIHKIYKTFLLVLHTYFKYF